MCIILQAAVSCAWYSFYNYNRAPKYQREPLDASYCDEVPYVVDVANLGVDNSITRQGMKLFYKRTRVQPIIVTTEGIEGDNYSDDEVIETYMAKIYDGMVEGEGHVLFLYLDHCDGEFSIYWLVGSKAKAVVDDEACDIVFDTFLKYSTSILNDDEFISKAFDEASSRMMTSPNSWIVITVVTILAFTVVVIVCVTVWFKLKKKEQKLKEMELAAEILKADL